jgi:hypothetical protein
MQLNEPNASTSVVVIPHTGYVPLPTDTSGAWGYVVNPPAFSGSTMVQWAPGIASNRAHAATLPSSFDELIQIEAAKRSMSVEDLFADETILMEIANSIALRRNELRELAEHSDANHPYLVGDDE